MNSSEKKSMKGLKKLSLCWPYHTEYLKINRFFLFEAAKQVLSNIEQVQFRLPSICVVCFHHLLRQRLSKIALNANHLYSRV